MSYQEEDTFNGVFESIWERFIGLAPPQVGHDDIFVLHKSWSLTIFSWLHVCIFLIGGFLSLFGIKNTLQMVGLFLDLKYLREIRCSLILGGCSHILISLGPLVEVMSLSLTENHLTCLERKLINWSKPISSWNGLSQM